ncbi:S-layer homology domain-containing protein [Bacillus sp. FJAT-29790]|uniref:S-layer homology domain-containing protein n=1 Tax=Bacillus sp. FJAT-29790 TaxID=1895002 RepID=UPI001C21D08B|nr:S-layer homology domain-containing protein [Bacillus sp. FJAT-29790]MBU8881127.1 S-layer homology domain-containing protein [Bacillus sp. FJAT-29790]
MNDFRKRAVSLFFILLCMILALPGKGSAASPFKDVNNEHWAYPAIEWAYNKGLIKGYPDGTFAPNRTLTEAQFAAILTRYDCSNTSSLQAAPGEHHASGIYRYLLSKNIPLNGYTNLKARDEPITRGLVARVIAAFEGSDLSEPYAVQNMYLRDLSTGSTGKKDYKDYRADRTMTRAEAAVFYNRLSKNGSCWMSGLASKAGGRDDNRIELPPNFFGDDAMIFPPPELKPQPKPPIISIPYDSRLEDLDIEKPSLIANGVDSSFITLMLKDCYGGSIPEENSLTFQVTSKAGELHSGDPNDHFYYQEFDEKEYEKNPNATLYSSNFSTDGSNLTIKVTAPRSKKTVTDTISFRINDETKNSENMSCYQKPVTVQLEYVPQAELRIETTRENNILLADGRSTMTVTAKIVRPGGQVISDFNGRVLFRSSKGANLSTREASFYNGEASTTLTSLWSTQLETDEIRAEIVQVDSRYKDEVASLLNKTHRYQVVYDPEINLNNSCLRGDMEVAFIIDSSGSMKRSDPERLRVSKSKEFMTNLNAPSNIAAHFDSRGNLLYPTSDSVYWVRPTLDSVRQSGGTNIAQGMEVAFNQYSNNYPKIAILLTDGKSNERQVKQMLLRARAEQIKIFTIGLGSKTQLNETLLQQLAYETGGEYYHVTENIHIGSAYQSILNEVTCDIPAPSCSYSDQMFISPTLEYTSTDFYMNTYINENCGEIARVLLRFHSFDGNIDYELVHRGQNYYALKKSMNEISELLLYQGGTFLAYDLNGYLVGQKSVRSTSR